MKIEKNIHPTSVSLLTAATFILEVTANEKAEHINDTTANQSKGFVLTLWKNDFFFFFFFFFFLVEMGTLLSPSLWLKYNKGQHHWPEWSGLALHDPSPYQPRLVNEATAPLTLVLFSPGSAILGTCQRSQVKHKHLNASQSHLRSHG